jgi:hypothetical protein
MKCRHLLVALLPWLIPNLARAQHHNVRLTITKAAFDTKGGYLTLSGQVQNDDSTRTFLKPQGDLDFCHQLTYAEILDLQTKKESSYFPCKWVADLDHIVLTDKNTITVAPNSSYSFTMKLKSRSFNRPLLPRHSYRLKLHLNHHDICGGQLCKAFTGTLVSNGFPFTIK